MNEGLKSGEAGVPCLGKPVGLYEKWLPRCGIRGLDAR
jgi:hypothetical protein